MHVHTMQLKYITFLKEITKIQLSCDIKGCYTLVTPHRRAIHTSIEMLILNISIFTLMENDEVHVYYNDCTY